MDKAHFYNLFALRNARCFRIKVLCITDVLYYNVIVVISMGHIFKKHSKYNYINNNK